MKVAMIRVLGLFVSVSGLKPEQGFFSTVFVDLGPLPEMRLAARNELLTRMVRHDVTLRTDGAFRSLCVMVSFSSVDMDRSQIEAADGFTFFAMRTVRSRVSGGLESAWRRWRHPEMVLV